MHINVTAYRLKKKSVCPITKGALSSKDISKPGRLVLNILAELLRFCPNIGCSWRGINGLYAGHCNSCEFKSKGDVFTNLEQVLLTGLIGVCMCTDICLQIYTLQCPRWPRVKPYLYGHISLYLYSYMYMY
jgi:hypothetical protein